MNAVTHLSWNRLRAELVSDVKNGGPIEYIELSPEETLRWIAQEEDDNIVETFVATVKGLDDKQSQALESLLVELMGDVTADRLIAARDFVRRILCERCSQRARDAVEEDLS